MQPDRPASVPRLEPLGVGEVLDAAFRLYRQHFVPLFKIAVVLIAPLQLITYVWQSSAVFGVDRLGRFLVDDENAFLLVSLLITGLSLIVQSLILGSLTHHTVHRYLGTAVGWVDSITATMRRVMPFVGLVLVFSIFTGIAALALLIPGIFVAVSMAVAPAAFFAEDTGPLTSIRRSFELIRGTWWATFGALVVIVIVGTIINVVVATLVVPFSLTTDNLSLFLGLSALALVLQTALFYPLAASTTTVVYYDRRVRKEGFDLQLRTRSLGGPGRFVTPEGHGDASTLWDRPEGPSLD